MTIFIGIVLSIIISIITSSLLPIFNWEESTVSTLYTVSGIMFSIGMSLIVTTSASDIKNKNYRKGIRTEIKSVRDKFIMCFALISLIYVFLPINEPESCFVIYKVIQLNYSHLLICIMLYSIIYFIRNFLAIQQLKDEIEDALLNEDED